MTCWADRAGVGVTIFLLVVGFVILAMLGTTDADNFSVTTKLAVFGGGFVWMVCRLVDFIFGGPWRRGGSSY